MTDGIVVGALDQGTGGTRFVVFDERGRPVSKAFTAHQHRTRSSDRIEYDPLRLWGCATDAIRRGLVEADVDSGQLRALGISSQRQTLLAWEAATGDPVTPALSWQDRRGADVVGALTPDERALVRERTGLEPDAYFAAPTATRLLDERGDGTDVRARAAAGEVLLGTIDSWLLYNLTGTHATDVTNAAQTMLFDVRELGWDEDLLALFDVPRAALPTVRPSSDPEGFGTTDPNGVLNAAVPITGVLGDQQAALLGRSAFRDGDAKVTYGTGNFFLQNTGTDPVEAGDLLTTIWFQRAGERPWYGLEGPVFATGAVLEWLQTTGILENMDRLDRIVATDESAESVYFVPSFGGTGAPTWASDLGTAILGMTRDTRQEDVVRAAVEAIAFGTRAVIEAAEAATGVEHDRLMVDGGAVRHDDFLQSQADLLGRSLVRSDVTQTTALGAGFAAGLAVGVWDSRAELCDCRPAGQTFAPSDAAEAFDEKYRRWRDVVDAVTDVSV
ncbi:MAG: FGGY family carbohydrate kinase [Haloarculaceae archaeon]